MDSYSIGISGLDAAQKALDIIGNNVANAATDGYHRQRINLAPAYSVQVGSTVLGGGVEFTGITRMVDSLLEQEILHQQSASEQVSSESATLRTVESAFGELSSNAGGLSAAIDKFFSALTDLSAHPQEPIWQNQVIADAQAMTGQFRTLGKFLSDLENNIGLEAKNTIDQINILTNKIAEQNNEIERIEITGGQANNLRDQRDQRIKELSGLIGVQTQARENGVVDVTAGGIAVVTGTSCNELEVGLRDDGSLGIAIVGAYSYKGDIQGGRLGGLLSLKNQIISGISNNLDDLACAIIQQINQCHVQGVGSDGSFTELTGRAMTSQNLADFEPPVTNGTIYIRVINTSTGEITRSSIAVNAANNSLSDIADAITAIDGLSASVVSSKLHIQADANYKFDFLPAVLPLPTNSTLTGSAPAISVSGIYSGTENQTFTFTVKGTGSVGNGTLQLEVKNGAGEVVTTLNVGSGYAAGDNLDVADGIRISLGTGGLNDAESFQVNAFADTDTSGVLAAAGINTFFFGTSASNMAVSSDIAAAPGRIATALGQDMTDNTNALRLAGLKDQTVTDLDSTTPAEFYRRLVTDIGQQLNIKQISQDDSKVIIQDLANQQSDISGVDINDEAARLLVFQQMFQAMAKYLNTVQSSVSTIMQLL